jgi:hypothetical protein
MAFMNCTYDGTVIYIWVFPSSLLPQSLSLLEQNSGFFSMALSSLTSHPLRSRLPLAISSFRLDQYESRSEAHGSHPTLNPSTPQGSSTCRVSSAKAPPAAVSSHFLVFASTQNDVNLAPRVGDIAPAPSIVLTSI